MNLSQALASWAASGQRVPLGPFGHQVFIKQLGNPQAAPEKTLLLIHGFPESSYSYNKVLDGLMTQFERIVLCDLPGYGLSDKPTLNYAYSLIEQADMLLQVWQHCGVSGGHVLAHDMGDSVATELVARHVADVMPHWFRPGMQSVTFTNGSMVLALADFRITQKLLISPAGRWINRLTNRRTFNQQVRSANGNDRLSQEDLDRLWENLCLQGGKDKTYLTIRYLHDRRRFERTRWLPALANLSLPVHLCWADADAVARIEMAHYLKAEVCQQAVLTQMPGAGHFCQLSDPEIWLSSVLGFYAAQS